MIFKLSAFHLNMQRYLMYVYIFIISPTVNRKYFSSFKSLSSHANRETTKIKNHPLNIYQTLITAKHYLEHPVAIN